MHIFGVALLTGGALPLALRLAGVWKQVPAAGLKQVLTVTGGTGFILAVIAGLLLFTTGVSRYVHSGLFIAKMIVLAVGTSVSVSLWKLSGTGWNETQPACLLRVTAWLLVFAWPAVLVLGRLVGYF